MGEELRLVISEDEIRRRVRELGAQITRDYRGQEVVFVGILKGALIFLADLVRAVQLPNLEIDFVRLSSYGESDSSSGKVVITKDLELPLEGKHVLVVEDIVDTGYTLSFFKEKLEEHRPSSVRFCCLIDKSERREIEVNLDYCGFKVPRGFLVGYGLDFAEKYRHLPGIYEVVRTTK